MARKAHGKSHRKRLTYAELIADNGLASAAQQ